MQVSLEANIKHPVVVACKKPAGYMEHHKVFLYSKVVSSQYLNKIAKTKLPSEPWLHCIQVPKTNFVIAYIWDTREIFAIEENKDACKALQKADLKSCVVDAYSAWDRKPMLLNSAKYKGALNAMRYLKDWVEPNLNMPFYRIEAGMHEMDIEINAPGKGQDILIGTYKSDTKTYELDLAATLLSDVYTLVTKSQDKTLVTKGRGILTYNDIIYTLIEGLTTVNS